MPKTEMFYVNNVLGFSIVSGNAGGKLGATLFHAMTIRPDCLHGRCMASTTIPRFRISLIRGVTSLMRSPVISDNSLFVAFGTALKATKTCLWRSPRVRWME
jgi:hypothetical protein